MNFAGAKPTWLEGYRKHSRVQKILSSVLVMVHVCVFLIYVLVVFLYGEWTTCAVHCASGSPFALVNLTQNPQVRPICSKWLPTLLRASLMWRLNMNSDSNNPSSSAVQHTEERYLLCKDWYICLNLNLFACSTCWEYSYWESFCTRSTLHLWGFQLILLSRPRNGIVPIRLSFQLIQHAKGWQEMHLNLMVYINLNWIEFKCLLKLLWQNELAKAMHAAVISAIHAVILSVIKVKHAHWCHMYWFVNLEQGKKDSFFVSVLSIRDSWASGNLKLCNTVWTGSEWRTKTYWLALLSMFWTLYSINQSQVCDSSMPNVKLWYCKHGLVPAICGFSGFWLLLELGD